MTRPLERPAAELLPGDLLRQGNDLFLCRYVAVSPDSVTIEAVRIIAGRSAEPVTLHLTPGEFVRVPATSPGGDNVGAAALLTT